MSWHLHTILHNTLHLISKNSNHSSPSKTTGSLSPHNYPKNTERKDKPGTIGPIPFLILGERESEKEEREKEIGWGGNNRTAVIPKELWVSCRSCFKQLSVASFEPLIFDLINSFEVYVGNGKYKVCLHVFFSLSCLHLSFSERKDTLVLYSVSRWIEIWLSNLPGPLELTVGPV